MQGDSAARTAGQTAAATMGGITTTTLILIALFAALVVAVVIRGTLRRRQMARDRVEAEEHRQSMEQAALAPLLDGGSVSSPVASQEREITAAATPVSPSHTGDQPLTLLKGLGPKVAARLGELGYHSIGQLATLNAEQAAALDTQLGSFSGRMARDRWIEQALLLTAGDRAGYEAAFGKIGR